MNLTTRTLAIGAGAGVLALAGALITVHVVFSLKGIDDGGVVSSNLQVVIGSAVTTLGAVTTFIFGGRD